MEKPERILRNRARCGACGDVIESRNRHDYVTCSCGETSVDGGLDYLRRGYGEKGFEELSEYVPPGAIVVDPNGEIER